jgi:hypothetical protein
MRTCLLLLAGIVCLAAADQNWHFVPPAEGGAVNVKDYGAVGDGKTDDTDAIMKAIKDNIDKSRYRSNAWIYFPKGTYLVSGPIEGRVDTHKPELAQGKIWSAGWRSMMLLIGESRTESIIKLKDQAEGYGDPKKPKWVVACGSEGDNRKNFAGGGNRAFRRHWPGPAMIVDVTIDGFNKGMQLAHYQYGMTFEGITMRNQRSIGVRNNQNVLAMRHVDFEGSVPFYFSDSGHNLLSLLDSKIVGIGTSDKAAITTQGLLNLRRTSFTGFASVANHPKGNRVMIKAEGDTTMIDSYDIGFKIDAKGGDAKPLNLPIDEIPLFRPKPGEWTVAAATGAELQAQIDAGAEYIYVPPLKAIQLTEPLILRNKLKLMFGGNGHLKVEGDNKIALRVENGDSPAVVLEHMYVDGGIDNVSDRSFVLRHGDIHGATGYRGLGKGKGFIMDVIGKGYEIGPDHTFFAWQLNAEFGNAPLFTNSGTSWIFGFKMESSTRNDKKGEKGTPSLVNKSGQTELFAGLLYTLGSQSHHAPVIPAFTNESGKVAISYRTNGIPKTYYSKILRIGSFENGEDLIPANKIKGPGAALLTDER